MTRLLLGAAALALLTVFVSCGGDDTEDIAAFCDLAAEATANASQEMTPDEEREALEEFRDAAPDEIREDVDIVIDGALESLDGDESAASSEEYQEAGANLSEWGEENCPQAE